MKDKIIYSGLRSDELLIQLSKYCFDNNHILVFITPVVKEYNEIILKSMDILKDDLWIYEISFGLRATLCSRARKYQKIYGGLIVDDIVSFLYRDK